MTTTPRTSVELPLAVFDDPWDPMLWRFASGHAGIFAGHNGNDEFLREMPGSDV